MEKSILNVGYYRILVQADFCHIDKGLPEMMEEPSIHVTVESL